MNLTQIVIEGNSVKGGLDRTYVVSVVVATIMAIAGVIDAIGRPVWGFIMDKFKSTWSFLAFIYIGYIIGFIVFLLLYKTPIGAGIGAIWIFIFYGGTSIAHTSAGMALFGTKRGGAITSSTLIAVGCAWVLGPILTRRTRPLRQPQRRPNNSPRPNAYTTYGVLPEVD